MSTHSSLGLDWQKSPAHWWLLSKFLQPRTVEDVAKVTDWDLALAESPQMAIQRFLDARMLMQADLIECMHHKFKAAELKVMLKERGLTVAGPKDEQILRLVQADRSGMEQLATGVVLLKCSEEGRKAVEEFSSQHRIQSGGRKILTWDDLKAIGLGVAGDALFEAVKGLIGGEPVAPAQPPTPSPLPIPVQPTTTRQPSNAEAYFQRGFDYERHGDHQQALTDYNQANFLDVQYAKGYLNRSVAYVHLGDYQRALVDCNQAIALDPQYALAYYNRGVAYVHLGDYQRTLVDCNQAIALDPQYALAYYNRGVAYGYLGDYQRELADYNQAIALDPQDAKVYYNRGIAYGYLGDYQRGLADYNQAIALDPLYAKAYYNRGIVHGYLGDYQQALTDYNQAIELDPQDAKAYYHRGVAYAKRGDYQQALADYGQSIDLNPFIRAITEKQTHESSPIWNIVPIWDVILLTAVMGVAILLLIESFVRALFGSRISRQKARERPMGKLDPK
jgi:tetratricopeptide (TPR) repeat protein